MKETAVPCHDSTRNKYLYANRTAIYRYNPNIG
jgi:hypothetical protein